MFLVFHFILQITSKAVSNIADAFIRTSNDFQNANILSIDRISAAALYYSARNFLVKLAIRIGHLLKLHIDIVVARAMAEFW